MFAVLALAAVAALAPQAPTLTIGIAASPDEAHFLQGARLAAEACNQKGGIDGATVALVIENVDTPAVAAAAADKLNAAGAVAVLAPLDARRAEAVRRACQNKLPCVQFAPRTAQVVATIASLCDDPWVATRIAVVKDASPGARDFAKALTAGLRAPAAVVLELDFRATPKALAKELAETKPEVLIVDGDPDAAARFLTTVWADTKIPAVLTPRAFGAPILAAKFDVWAVLGQSPATRVTTTSFRNDYEGLHGDIGFGAAEGFEAVTLVLRAADTAGTAERPAVATALRGASAEGARGRVELDAKTSTVDPPLGVWRIAGGVPTPYMPVLLSAAFAAGGGTRDASVPDPNVGVPFGTWRANRFVLEEGTQWVVCTWNDTDKATIDNDIAELGLSTRGASPLVDRIVKDEIMARVLAITSTRYGRNEDGTAIPGKSLKISFGTHADEKKRRLWNARFGGDDDSTGGRAFGTYCEIYSTFIRRTIFQEHALTPALTPEDLTYLDGTYAFGFDPVRDKRSNLIRALINGYGGSMALTNAHEVGHLCGLGHVTDDPKEIMNVEEGAGIDYPEAHFGAPSWAHLTELLGISEDPNATKPRKK